MRTKRPKDEVLARDGAGRKQCVRCQVWLPESVFCKDSDTSDGLRSWCKRCIADSMHYLSVKRRQQMLADQDGKCVCGKVFDVYGGLGLSYEIDHDHGHCPGRFSCGACIRALVCRSCNMRDRNNPDRTGSGASKYRGVTWNKPKQKWQVSIQRGGKQFYPTVIGLPSRYTDEDEAGQVAAQLDAHLDANPQLWQPTPPVLTTAARALGVAPFQAGSNLPEPTLVDIARLNQNRRYA